MTVKRPMLWLSAAFVAGMYLLALLGASIAFAVIFCALIAAIVKAVKKKKLYDNFILFAVVLLLAAGVLHYGMKDDLTAKDLFAYCEESVVLTGEVTENPKTGENYIRFPFKVTQVVSEAGETKEVSEKISLTYFFEKNSNKMASVPQRGDVVTVSGAISVPDAAMNTGGFDYRVYLKTQGIFFQATADGEQFFVTNHNHHPVSDVIYRLRERCANLFENTFPQEESGVLKAYVLGDKSDVDETVSELFSASGLSHVLAVSGMHVTVFLSAVTAFLTLIRLSKRKQLILLLCAVVFFVLFTGSSVSAIRAGVVCFLAVFAQLIFKRSDPLTALAEAAAILCFINPLVILSASFMLSFSATLGILLFASGMSERFSLVYIKLKPDSKTRKILKATCDLTAVGLSAQLLTIPVLIHVFQSFSTMSFLATLLLTPVLAPLLVGGFLFCTVGWISSVIAVPIAGFLYALAKYMIFIAEVFANTPISQIAFGGITPFILLCYLMFVLLVYFIAVRQSRVGVFISLYSLAALSLLFLCHSILRYPVAEVSFINVGQGDCALIQAPGNCDILIDAGGREEDYSVGEETVKPYLVQKGVYDIEYAVASHGHVDHINGIVGLLDVITVKNLVVPAGFGTTEEAKVLLAKALEKGVPVTYVKHGDVITLRDDMHLTAIMPDDKVLNLLSGENDRSLLLRLTYGEVSFLFTGDLSSTGENYAATAYPDSLSAAVMKAAHHGSKTANGDALLNAVEPKYVYIPVGENSYGQPGREVLQRFSEKNIRYYRADVQGDVTFYFDSHKINGIKYNERILAGG